MSTYVYKQTQSAGRDGATENLFTVGFYRDSATWDAESDWPSTELAAARVHYLNGGKQAKSDASNAIGSLADPRLLTSLKYRRMAHDWARQKLGLK